MPGWRLKKPWNRRNNQGKFMYELTKLVFEICLFKKGPQHLPYSNALLKLLVFVDLGISFLMFTIQVNILEAFLQAFIGVMLVLMISGVIVYLGKKPRRFTQTACALVGVDAVISFFALPAMATLNTGYNSELVIAVMIGLMIWHWAVTGHIFRHALDQTFVFGLGLAFLTTVASYQVITFLFPEVSGVN